MVVFRAPRSTLFVLSIVAVFILAGCSIFAPPGGKKKPRPPAQYRLRTSPENVMHNVQTAYGWMNDEEYLDCLSEDFVFYPAEEDVGGDIPEEWYKSDERIVHENMFDENGNVDSVTLQLTSTAIETLPGADPVDPLDDIHVYEEAVDLYVHLHGDLSYHASTPSIFHIRVDEDQVGPNDEVLYEIFEWYDTGPPDSPPLLGRSRDPLVETVTLGRLRQLFLN